MKKGKIVLVVLTLIMVLGMIPAQAEVPHKGDWAIGSHLSLPAIGLSLKYWVTEKWCAQFTLIPSITQETGPSTDVSASMGVSAYAGKAIYKFKEGKNHYFYGALAAGSLTLHSASSGYGYQHESESSISGVSLSVGFEWLLIKWFVLSLDIGYGWFDPRVSMNGDPVDLGEYETIISPMVGIGFHTYFF